MAFCKAGDWHNRACSRIFCKLFIQMQAGEQGTEKYHRDGGRGGCVLGIQSAGEPQLPPTPRRPCRSHRR